eukprot:TRINITY_DN2138_c0_g1_i1.p1 TRINITY_DN2138_c0_g1~~TRINITY_DN2138_c0_g1_i1.p1  ORF type:complete len:212 (-),score=50.66 TRINITY_DN2138_c0_g1_i1:49-684(-)
MCIRDRYQRRVRGTSAFFCLPPRKMLPLRLIFLLLSAACIALFSLILAGIIGEDCMDVGYANGFDCVFYVEDDDVDGNDAACNGTLVMGVFSGLFGICLVVFIVATIMGKAISIGNKILLGIAVAWTFIWIVLAIYISAGWNKTCDTFEDYAFNSGDCEDVCGWAGIDYDSISSAVAFTWLTLIVWVITTIIFGLSLRNPDSDPLSYQLAK